MVGKYIRIRNTADSVSRVALEKLGFSSKRNDPNTIGQFGSGIKYAPIAALRKGWDWIFVGKDNIGPYTMKYAVEVEDGIDCVAYDYGDYIKSSSFTADAGVMSWLDAFQIYREAIANAMDACVDGVNTWSVDIVSADKVVYEPGYFSIFITAAPELMEIHNNYDKYFSVNRDVVDVQTIPWTSRHVKILSKIDSVFRVYSHGVLVFTSPNRNSVFDYDIDGLALNEERTAKSVWEIDSEIARAMATTKSTSAILKYLDCGLSYEPDTYYEFDRVSSGNYTSYSFSLDWNSCFKEVYGGNTVIYDKVGQARGVKEAISLRGYTPHFIDHSVVYDIMKFAGVAAYTSIANEQIMYDLDYNIDDFPSLKKAMSIARAFEPGLDCVIDSGRIAVFDGKHNAIGLTLNMSKPVPERVILIDKEHADSSIENIVGTLIHEYDHLFTGCFDGNDAGRVFRDLADHRIGRLMAKFYKADSLTVDDAGVISLPFSNIADFGSELKYSLSFVTTLDKYLLKIGNKTFFINSDIDYRYAYGSLVLNSDATAFTLPVSNIKEWKEIHV